MRNSYSNSSRGSSKDLQDSVDRLLDQELIEKEDICNALFRCDTGFGLDGYGHCSICKIVSIDFRLDEEFIPDWFIDEIVYHQCLHLRQLRMCKWVGHDTQFRQWKGLYPDSNEIYAIEDEDYRFRSGIDDLRINPWVPNRKRHVFRNLNHYLNRSTFVI